ncbi:MAG: glycosyltransferase [Nitrospirae bacterium]|nr:glycosyltransferase [Nitrospirota bacterium]
MNISAIVCTHNRSELLGRTLKSLAEQEYPSSGYEILVVDNLSTDKTKDVVLEFMARFRGKVMIRYIVEDKIGLSHARNRGIEESTGEIVAFIDDDARAEKRWLSALRKVYEDKEDAMCVGGKVILEWSSPGPSWWSSEMDTHLSAVDYGDALKRLSYPEYPFGTNISFSRSAVKGVGMFNPGLGRIGKMLLAGEEIDICLNIEKKGGVIYYCPDMVVYHLAQPERLNKGVINKRAYWHGRSCALVEKRHFGARRVFNSARYMLRKAALSMTRISGDPQSVSSLYYCLGYLQQACLFWKGNIRKNA